MPGSGPDVIFRCLGCVLIQVLGFYIFLISYTYFFGNFISFEFISINFDMKI